MEDDVFVCKCMLPALIAMASHPDNSANCLACVGSVFWDSAPSLYPTNPISPSTEILDL